MRRKSATSVYMTRLRNLAKARRVKRVKRVGMGRHRRVGRPRIHRRRIGTGRPRVHLRRYRGGIAPAAALAAIQGVHSTLQSIKPATQLENLLTSTGVKGYLDKKYSNSKIYNGIKSVGNFLTKTLGYGRRRPRRKVGGARRRRVYRRS